MSTFYVNPTMMSAAFGGSTGSYGIFVKGYIPFGIYDGGVMIGKFLKKLLSAAMCAALIAGVGYSTDRLMGELSGVVFADEAEQTDRQYTYYEASVSTVALARRSAVPADQSTAKQLAGTDLVLSVMEHNEAVQPLSGAVAVTAEPFVNVRMEAGTDSEIVGRFYPGSGGVAEETKDGWTKIVSGDVSGYVKTEYLLFGDEAEEVYETQGTKDSQGEWHLPEAVDMDQVYKEALEAEQASENRNQASAPSENAPSENSQGQTVQAGTSDAYLLACLVYSESGNQSYEGQLAVANVVLNRVKSPLFPNTISEVIYQKGQFSPASSGTLASVLASGPSQTSIKAANDALAGVNNIGNYLFFNGYVDTSKVNSYVVIEDHTFYN